MKKIIILISALSISALSNAADGYQNDPYSGQYYDNSNRGSDVNSPGVQDGRVPTSDPRWYKSRSGRQEYLKGGTDYPRS